MRLFGRQYLELPKVGSMSGVVVALCVAGFSVLMVGLYLWTSETLSF